MRNAKNNCGSASYWRVETSSPVDVLRGEVKRDDPYEYMQSEMLEQVAAPAFAEVPPPPAPVPEAAPEPPAAVPEARETREAVPISQSKATFPKPPPPKKAASYYIPPPVPPPKQAPPVPPKQVAVAETLRPPPKKEVVAPAKAASSCSVWGDLDELRPAKGNADQQFPDLSSGPQSKKEKQKTAAKNLTLMEPMTKVQAQAQAAQKFGQAQRAPPTFALQDLMKPSKKGRSAKIFAGKAALPQQTGAFVEEAGGDLQGDCEPASSSAAPVSKLTPSGILQRAPREKRDDGSRRERDPKGEDGEDVEVTTQTQMKIDPQKPLRILQKPAEEKAKDQEAHAPRAEPRTEAYHAKGAGKGEGKGKGGKSKDKGKSKGKGRGPRRYGEDSDAEWSVASHESHSEDEEKEASSPMVVVSSEDEDSGARPLQQEKGHGKKGKGKNKGKDKKGGKKGWIVKTKSIDSDDTHEEATATPEPEPSERHEEEERRLRNLKSVLESRAATRAEAERQRKLLREKAAGAEVQPVKETSPSSPAASSDQTEPKQAEADAEEEEDEEEQEQEEEEEEAQEEPVVPQSSILSEEAMGRLNPVADTGLALGIGMVCVQGEEKEVDSDELLDFETVKNRTEKKAEMREQRRVQEEQATRAAIRREAQRQRDLRAKEAQEAKMAAEAAEAAEAAAAEAAEKEAARQAPRQQRINLADLRRTSQAEEPLETAPALRVLASPCESLRC
ncbi:unnamed protein product [Symbiodinium natans]|uniref:Uncharacterized protein n=1 Tax=Symbiodinium natans TaxID=878477 RepID=A0A812GMK9_9DINO|nr:unnamed protein product [Symbiodinium natans]